MYVSKGYHSSKGYTPGGFDIAKFQDGRSAGV